jgi:hypothetical protein
MKKVSSSYYSSINIAVNFAITIILTQNDIACTYGNKYRVELKPIHD